jgi:hypothetical protein
VVDKIIFLVFIAPGSSAESFSDRLVIELIQMYQCPGMDLDHVIDDELHAGQPNAFDRQTPPPKGRRRAGHVHHDFGFGLGDVLAADLRGFKIQDAYLDMALVAFGA